MRATLVAVAVAALIAAAAGPAAATTVLPPSQQAGATLAGVVAATPAFPRPGGGRRVWQVSTETSWSGEPQVLLVLGSAQARGRQWLRVLLPVRPDGTSAWISRDDVELLHTSMWVTVDKRARQVRVYRSGRPVKTFAAVIGKPATPTPDGLAAVWEVDRQANPNDFIGSWALPLTIFSNVLMNFGGGPGRVAIHGRSGASLSDPLGSARSHGCIRIDNASVAWLAGHVGQGTPVEIVG
jgi:lipoprotein-anchoring transpeptidase ErfK/SrfK